MSKRMFLRACFGLMTALVLAAACMPLPAPTGSTGAVATQPASTTVAATRMPTSTIEIAATAEVRTSLPPSTTGPLGASTPVPTASAVEGAAGQDQGRRITLEDDGKTITLQPGERVLLYLGEGYNWDVAIADQNVISRVPGILTIRGSQGLFEAQQEGTSAITATGDPACRQSQPPCAMPSRTFGVQIVVKAGSS